MATSNLDPAAARTGGRYFAGLIAGLVSVGVALLAIIALTDRLGHLPPPSLSNNLCIDEKLNFIRERSGIDPTVLFTGSSVTWRQLDGAAFAAQTDTPFNGGMCGLKAHQTAFVTEWLLDHFHRVSTVITIVAPQDFESCTPEERAVFSREDGNAYVFDRSFGYLFYFTHFDPWTQTRNAFLMARRRSNDTTFDSVVMDDYGTGRITQVLDRDWAYPNMRLDEACFAEFRALALGLRQRGIEFFVVNTPIKPDWLRKHDPDGKIVAAFDAGMRRALQGAGARYWDAHRELDLATPAFADPIHLKWDAARRFSREIAARLEKRTSAAN